MLPPSAIAGVSLVWALGPWVFSEPVVLRSLAAAAAVTAVTGAFVMRHWDVQAGKRVAELTRARASEEWRHEERVAELETDLEESRALRARLERRLRAKRAELQALRSEHAALLRRYATAETERAGALEGRRLLEKGAVSPARALGTGRPATAPEADGAGSARVADEEPGIPGVFSPEGARLFLRAGAALARLGGAAAPGGDDGGDGGGGGEAAAEPTDTGTSTDAATGSAQAPGHRHGAPAAQAGPAPRQPAGSFAVPAAAAVVPPASARRPVTEGGFDFFGTKGRKPQPEQQPEQQARARTQPGARAASPGALEAVQDEDLADVVGQEALAPHRAGERPEREGARSPQESQVIDLTAHDETEQIDVQGLRTAAS
ncbi:hypothetical protein SUDANB6_02674 [Streptomyces sp. enrichment culture]|uniref:hypothetical protein n=1 Tax=Streptomyces sp. enrichment culture TaxID=1795815 RepID=UPI003F558153